MSTFVKICGLRTAEDIDAAVGAGADAVGFVFAQSVRQIAPAAAAQLAAQLPSYVQCFAVTRHPTKDELDALFAAFTPNFLQTDADDLHSIELPAGCLPMPVYREGAQNIPTDTALLFEGRDSGTGQTADWTQAAAVARQSQMILAGGLHVDNVAAAIEQVRPWGVDVSSGVERERGIKDPKKISAFIARVRAQETDGDKPGT